MACSLTLSVSISILVLRISALKTVMPKVAIMDLRPPKAVMVESVRLPKVSILALKAAIFVLSVVNSVITDFMVLSSICMLEFSAVLLLINEEVTELSPLKFELRTALVVLIVFSAEVKAAILVLACAVLFDRVVKELLIDETTAIALLPSAVILIVNALVPVAIVNTP